MNDIPGFLASLYTHLLGREADAAGLAHWSAELSAGHLSPGQLIALMAASPEARAEVVPVAQLYLAVLGRVPDAAGLAYWVDAVRGGMSQAELVACFAASAEFAARVGGEGSDAAFVALVYQQALGRTPEAGGLAHFTQQLAQGVSRADVLAAISASEEAVGRTADAVQAVLVYLGAAGRPPSAEELKAVLDAGNDLPLGARLEQLADKLLDASAGPGPQPEPEPEPGPGPGPDPQPEPLPEPALFTVGADTTGGSSDASTAVALDEHWMIVGDDEASLLRVYPRGGGEAVLEWDYGAAIGVTGEVDLEASVMVGNVLYLTGSHSNKRSGAEADSRELLFAVKVTGTGADTQFVLQGHYTGLEGDLVAWDEANGHGLGVGALGLAAGSAGGVSPEQMTGFSIEGMTVAPDGETLWLGFRAPQHEPSADALALLVPVLGVDALLASGGEAQFGSPILLDLGGRGIRSMELAADGSGYLILAGPAGSASDAVTHDFRLFTWTGVAEDLPVELDTDLDSLLAESGGSFESLLAPASLKPGTHLQLLQDNGDTVWPGQTVVSKDLPFAEQKFWGNWVTLGEPYVDEDGPVAVRVSPADGTDGAAIDMPFVLVFDEAVKRGEGVIELRDGNGELVQSFDVTDPAQVQFSYNQVSVRPTVELAYEAAYSLVVGQGAIIDRVGNAFTGFDEDSPLSFVTSEPPTELLAGDVLFVAGNAEAPDAFAFILLRDVTGSTRVAFTDRDYAGDADGFSGITNEMAFVWTAGRDLPAGTIITIQTDTDGNPLADIGGVVGRGGGIGKSETLYAMQGAVIENLTDGSAGLITDPGTFLASLTLGGPAGVIPASLIEANAAFSFIVDPANQTNARYFGSLDTSDLAALAERIANSEWWESNSTKAPGFPLVDGSFFGVPLLSYADVDGDTLTLRWNQPVDALNLPATGAFEVTVDGEVVTVLAVDTDGLDVYLTLAETVAGGAMVGLSYTDPTSGDDLQALQSVSGRDIGSFTLDSLLNLSPDAQAPLLVSRTIATDADGQALHFAPLVLTFNEMVLKGEGQIVLTALGGGEPIVVNVASAGEVTVSGNQVIIDPVAALAAGAWYEVTLDAGSFQDAAGNAFEGLGVSEAWQFETASRPLHSLLITEVNSNGGPADYFELLNYGQEAIDLSGWSMIDNNGQHADAVSFADGTLLEAGAVMVVVLDIRPNKVSEFRQVWSLDDDVNLVAIDGPGLGQGDAVVVFDDQGYVAAAFNYGTAALATSDDGLWSSSLYGGSGSAKLGKHVGEAYGGNKSDSAVWDGLSLDVPSYVAAAAGQNGAYAATDNSLGSPGVVPDGWASLLAEGWLMAA